MIARKMPGLVLATALMLAASGGVPGVAAAQTPVQHETGQAWIHKDAPVITRVHLTVDESCFVEFEDNCYGGMMAPDSVLCVLGEVPEGEWPDQCLFAVDCDITDPSGGHMFDGGGMHQTMMQRGAIVTVRYSPATMAQMGFGHEDLCLVRFGASGVEVCGTAVQDPQAATFTLTTTAPSSSFAVVPRATLVETGPKAISSLKAQY